MKLPLLSMLILINGWCWSQTDHKQLEIEKVVPKERNCIEIPSSFSHEMVLESKSLNKLQSKKIARVELIYTRFKENENFDQVQLNEDRMYRLNQLLPRLKTDHPEIVWIEQTGARSAEDAAHYFHGFRIYTEGEYLKEPFTRISREDKSNPASMFTVDNSVGGDFSHPSGTLIHIPADGVVYENGKKVIGNYTFSYREYRDAAEMAFSGIPMAYHDKTGEYQFNSAGMYEIRGTKDGKSLKLQREVIVDFNCTKREAGINFYELDDKTGEWTVLREQLFAQADKWDAQENETVVVEARGSDIESPDPQGAKVTYVVSKPYYLVTLDEHTREAYRSLVKRSPQKILESVAQDFTTVDFNLKVRPEFTKPLIELILQEYNAMNNDINRKKMEVQQENTLLAGNNDKGHQYPNLVRGLNCDKFGVYNCDQIYQIANTVSFSPKYINAANQKEIQDRNILCVIDKDVNGSFSFDPDEITCNSQGENVFLLFTEDGEVYALRSEKGMRIDLSVKSPEFLMENITKQVTTSDDLKKYLDI